MLSENRQEMFYVNCDISIRYIIIKNVEIYTTIYKSYCLIRANYWSSYTYLCIHKLSAQS